MAHQVTLLSTGYVTHNVKRYVISKPDDYSFIPGQAVEIGLDKFPVKGTKRPFTFTNRPEDKVLEFTIKSYHDHNGMTHALWDAQPGDTLHIEKPFGTITYSKPGMFLAAGAGITPFLAIFRNLWARGELHNLHLLYSNKTKSDIICEHELTHYFTQQGNGLLLTLTRKSSIGYISGRITEAILREYCLDTTGMAYICGPQAFVQNMQEIVKAVGVPQQSIVTEK